MIKDIRSFEGFSNLVKRIDEALAEPNVFPEVKELLQDCMVITSYYRGIIDAGEKLSHIEENLETKLELPEVKAPMKEMTPDLMDRVIDFDKKRLENIPEEAYKVQGGKIVVDEEKLAKMNDPHRSYAFRCPNCFQSSILVLDKKTSLGLLRDLSTPLTLTMIPNLKDLFSIKESEEDIWMTWDTLHVFYKATHDSIFEEARKDSVAIDVDHVANGFCPVCGETHLVSKWVDAFKNMALYIPEGEDYHELNCPICGNEMTSTTEADGPDKENLSFKTQIKCTNKECNYSRDPKDKNLIEILG